MFIAGAFMSFSAAMATTGSLGTRVYFPISHLPQVSRDFQWQMVCGNISLLDELNNTDMKTA